MTEPVIFTDPDCVLTQYIQARAWEEGFGCPQNFEKALACYGEAAKNEKKPEDFFAKQSGVRKTPMGLIFSPQAQERMLMQMEQYAQLDQSRGSPVEKILPLWKPVWKCSKEEAIQRLYSDKFDWLCLPENDFFTPGRAVEPTPPEDTEKNTAMELLARKGVAFAQTETGAYYYRCYQNLNEDEDYKRAAAWFQYAVKQDRPKACGLFAEMMQDYANWHDLSAEKLYQTKEYMLKLMIKGCGLGDQRSAFLLAQEYIVDSRIYHSLIQKEQIVELLLPFARNGDDRLNRMLAEILDRKTRDEEEEKLMLECLMRGAEQGSVLCQIRLGDYWREACPAQAFGWYARAAVQGNQEALKKLGRCIENSSGLGKETLDYLWVCKQLARRQVKAFIADLNDLVRKQERLRAEK